MNASVNTTLNPSRPSFAISPLARSTPGFKRIPGRCSQELGGAKFLGNPSKYIVVYHLVCTTSHGASDWVNRNPATVFTFEAFLPFSISLTTIETSVALHPSNVKVWEEIAPQRETTNVEMARKLGSSFATVLLIQLGVKELDLVNMMWVPITHCIVPLPLSPSVKIGAREVGEMCAWSIAAGCPLRLTADSPTMPLPGRFVREKKTWIWEQFFVSWDEYSPTSKEYPQLHAVTSEVRSWAWSPNCCSRWSSCCQWDA
ncbi:hypothetical protein C8Q79DRAFT_925274 [Trametes meyenii]|nr:hypothetical protein C8Q79DRAFT_925274 [Trametes meyenii]